MNNKGFAISVILYSIVFLIVAILYMLLGIEKNRYNVNKELRDGVIEQLNEAEGMPSLPKMAEMCPNCVYMYTENSLNYGNNGTVLNPGSYSRNYNDVVASSSRKVFLGMILDESGKITRAFACGIHNDMPFCIEGNSSGSKHLQNTNYLTRIYGQYSGISDMGCRAYDNETHCYGSVDAFTNDDGSVYVGDGTRLCSVDSDGGFECGMYRD